MIINKSCHNCPQSKYDNSSKGFDNWNQIKEKISSSKYKGFEPIALEKFNQLIISHSISFFVWNRLKRDSYIRSG